MLSSIEWNKKNSGSILFMEKRRARGKKTALDYRPVLDDECIELWNMYCFMDENLLSSLDLYSRRIGDVVGWSFKESLTLMRKMKEAAREKEDE